MEVQMGPEAKAEVNFEGSDAILSMVYAGADAEASLQVKIHAKPLLIKALDHLKVLIPGQIDDAVIEEAKALLLKA